MFLPGETFFGAALQYDPELIEFGVGQASDPGEPDDVDRAPSRGRLRLAQERLAENAQAISDLGQELYGRLRTLAGHFEKLGGISIARCRPTTSGRSFERTFSSRRVDSRKKASAPAKKSRSRWDRTHRRALQGRPMPATTRRCDADDTP